MTEMLKFVWCWFILLLLIAISLGIIDEQVVSLVEMKPDNPVFEDGDTIVLNCTLTSDYNGSCNASQLFVEDHNMKYKYPYIRAITDSTAQFRLPNATVDNNGRFSCALPNGSVPDGRGLGYRYAQYVHVARQPLKPYFINFSVVNWEFLVCSWGPNSSTQNDHTQSSTSLRQILLWQYRGDGDTWQSCPQNESEKCVWRSPYFTMKKEYCIKINVSNTVSPGILSEIECRNPEFIVKPNPPSNIRKETTADEDGKTLFIKWDVPTSKNVSINYHVTVHSRWEEVRSFTVVNDNSLNFSTVPFTIYDIRIVASPSEPGFPSDESSAKLSSSSSVPFENPFVMRNFYSIDADERNAVLYWQPINEQNQCGPEFCYEVHGRALSTEWIGECIKSSYSADVKLNEYANDFQIVSRNKIGSALQPSSVIQIPSSDQLFSDLEVIAEGQNKNILVEWFITKPSGDGTTEYIMLFWCQSQSLHSHGCKTPIQLQTLNASEHGFNITVDEDFQFYQIGLSVKFTTSDYCGIKWAGKLHSLTAVPYTPRELQVSAPSGKHNELQIKWKVASCNKDCSYIRSFDIMFCPVDEQHRCKQHDKSITIFKSIDHSKSAGGGYDGSYTLEGLNFDTTYKIWMFSNAKQRQSQSSTFVTGTTTEPWFTPGKIVVIVVGILLAAAVVIFGLYVTFRCCDKYRKKLSSGFKVSLPPQRNQLPSTSSEAPMLRDQTPLEYWRQPSQMSTGSGDSGHYSFPPSSPAMLPLLAEESEKQEKLRIKNYYQQTNFNGNEKTEDDEGSENNTLDIVSYKIVPNGDLKAESRVHPTQYILPEQMNQIDKGNMATDSCNWLVSETAGSDVNYCNGFPFANSNGASDIGYTKIEQLPMMTNHCNQSTSNRSSADVRNKESNLLLSLDSQPEELNSTVLQPVVCHLDELLATLNNARPLTEDDCTNTELSTATESYPLDAIKVVEGELPMHSKQAPGSEESKNSESTIQGGNSQTYDDGYMPHTRLFGID